VVSAEVGGDAMSEYTKGPATAILSDDEILRRRDRNSFDSGYQAGVECHAELRAELLEALKEMVKDGAFAELCQAIGEEPSWLNTARAAIAKAEAKNV
jgi:hypothetical protein